VKRIDIIGQNGNDGDHYCEHEFTILLRSLNLKKCRLCYVEKPWKLDKGQSPLITSSKDKGF